MRCVYNPVMDLKQLESFVRVAQLGSFSKAALRLGLTQPTLSRQIRLLELELRHSLLHRNGRGVVLTPAGNVLLENAQAVLDSVARTRDNLDALRSDPQGRVVVGLPSRIARLVTTSLVREFRARFPHASISVAEGGSAVLHEWLMQGQVDAALLFEAPQSSELELSLVCTEELVLVGPRFPRAKAVTEVPLASIGDYPLIVPRSPNATRHVLEFSARRMGVRLRIAAEVDTLQNILELVAERMGYGVVPAGAVATRDRDRFSIARISGPTMAQHLYFASRSHGMQNRLVSQVREILNSLDLPRIMN
jgi:LysR family nitrogen assimilation transcriptional regulator